MSGTSYIPRKDSELVTFSLNLSTKINLDPTIYGLTITQASDYAALQTAYSNAYTVANTDSTRTKPTIVAKDEARAALVESTRQLVDIVQAYPGTTNEMRADLQITIRDTEPTPAPIPSTKPDMSIESTSGRTIRIRLRDADNPTSLGRPDGVAGANIMYYVGETAPSLSTEWVFGSMAGRPTTTLIIPGTVPAGSKIWITAFWFNTRKQVGPFATPLYTNISDSVQEAA